MRYKQYKHLVIIPLLLRFIAPINLQAFNPAPQERTTIVGQVVDAETGEPIDNAYVIIESTQNFVRTNINGNFRLSDVPTGMHWINTYRVGYDGTSREVSIQSNNILRIELKMAKSNLSGDEVVVESQRDHVIHSHDVAVEMGGEELQQNLGVTIAETIDDEAGISQRTFGPAPARPVLRGLSGDRVMILEDGGNTGDLSATSADHAVAIDPLTTERIEVIRGPASLIYNSSALGGVVNVIRNTIQKDQVSSIRGTSTLQAESVNSGYSGGVNFAVPLGNYTARLEGSYRSAQDINTPEGTLQNTGIDTKNSAIGISRHFSDGFAGLSANIYDSRYGIPGGFIGAHPGGVDIEITRRQLETRGSIGLNSPLTSSLEWRGGYSYYFHQEFEASGNVGIEFGVLSYNFRAMLNLKSKGIFQNGTIGVWTESRDYASGGFSFTPETAERSIALFGYQEAEVGRWLFQAAIRGDYREISPENERTSVRIGEIRQRIFQNVSGSFATIYNISPRLKSRFMVMRSFRAPLLEELFNEGPHLAAYSFEIGNPDLTGETGVGIEWNLSYHSDLFYLKGTLFHNNFSGYIFPRNTGQTNYRTLLPIYQYVGLDARFYGAELESHLQVGQHWRGDLTMSFVRASLLQDESPLPRIPPLHGKLNLEYVIGQLSAGATLRAAARQNRVDQFEEPTDGYAIVDLHAEYLLPRFSMMHSFSFSVNNVANTVYRKHLSRVKVVMPEPGRNFKFSYRVYF